MNEGNVYDMIYDSTRQIYLARVSELNTDEGLKSSRLENSQDYVSMLYIQTMLTGEPSFMRVTSPKCLAAPFTFVMYALQHLLDVFYAYHLPEQEITLIAEPVYITISF